MDLMLNDKVVIITGGTGGIGMALLHAFLEEKSNIVILDKNHKEGEKISHRFMKEGQHVKYFKVDMADPADIDRTFDVIFQSYSTIDILINNVGAFSSKPFLDISPADWDAIMNINLRSALLCSQKVIPLLKEKQSGVIINIGSVGGQTGGIFAGADYSASKAGIISLTKSLAKNFGGYGIRVNCVNPGPLETDMTKDWPPEVLDSLRQSMLIRQDELGTAEEIAHIIVFLCSEKASLIHGAQIDANGGIFIH